jgi:hypothetical protein
VALGPQALLPPRRVPVLRPPGRTPLMTEPHIGASQLCSLLHALACTSVTTASLLQWLHKTT